VVVDLQTVVERLEALNAYSAELDHYARFSFKELTSDFVKYRATQHSLLLAAQAVVDIAVHIVTADYNSRVQDYRQAIESLGNPKQLQYERYHTKTASAGRRQRVTRTGQPTAAPASFTLR
jgi:uncharacterized protein YutE (UPF0331/DUF86 family)